MKAEDLRRAADISGQIARYLQYIEGLKNPTVVATGLAMFCARALDRMGVDRDLFCSMLKAQPKADGAKEGGP